MRSVYYPRKKEIKHASIFLYAVKEHKIRWGFLMAKDEFVYASLDSFRLYESGCISLLLSERT
jgi:hypothetical protein